MENIIVAVITVLVPSITTLITSKSVKRQANTKVKPTAPNAIFMINFLARFIISKNCENGLNKFLSVDNQVVFPVVGRVDADVAAGVLHEEPTAYDGVVAAPDGHIDGLGE